MLGKYCHNQEFLKVTSTNSGSHGWRSLLIKRDLLENKLSWDIGDGKTTRVWQDPRLSFANQKMPIGPVPEDFQQQRVSELLLPNSTGWDKSKIQKLMPQYKNEILGIKPSKFEAPDILIWFGNSSGTYSKTSGYATVIKSIETNVSHNPLEKFSWHQSVWSNKTLLKSSFFSGKFYKETFQWDKY